MRMKALLTLVCVVSAGAASAAQVSVDFDSLTVPDALTTQFVGSGVVFEGATAISQTFGGQVVVP